MNWGFQGVAVGFEAAFEGGERGTAVEVGFTEAEEVEIGTVDHEDVFCHLEVLFRG